MGPSKDLKQVAGGCRGNCGSLQLHPAGFPPRGQPAVPAGICNPKSGECVIGVAAKLPTNVFIASYSEYINVLLIWNLPMFFFNL